MTDMWNLIMPTQLNQSVAVEALAVSLASSFEVAEVGEAGQPTLLRTRGAGAGSRAISVYAAEAEFTRRWAIAAADGDDESEVLDLDIQRDLIQSVAAYMEVHDLGYMPPTPAVVWEQFELDIGFAGRHTIPGQES